MKFRYRGGTRGFVARSVGRAVRRSYKGDEGGMCLIIVLLSILLIGGPLIIPILLVIAFTILPLFVVMALVVAMGIAIYFVIKNRYPQMFVSWFFLKENETDGTVLSFGEIKNRVKEFFAL